MLMWLVRPRTMTVFLVANSSAAVQNTVTALIVVSGKYCEWCCVILYHDVGCQVHMLVSSLYEMHVVDCLCVALFHW